MTNEIKEVKYKENFLETISQKFKPSIKNRTFIPLNLDFEKLKNLDFFTMQDIYEKLPSITYEDYRGYFSNETRPIKEVFVKKIVIVGAGGVTSWFLPQLIKILYNYKVKRNLNTAVIEIVLIDSDTVSERNLLRQNFIPEDIGRNKAEVLSERYNEIYKDVKVSYIPKYMYSSDFVNHFDVEFSPADFEEKYYDIDTFSKNYINPIFINLVDNEFSKHMLDWYLFRNFSTDPVAYFSTGCDLYNGNVFSTKTNETLYSIYFQNNTFIEEDAEIDTPECAVIAEQASMEQTFDSNNMAANVLAVLFNNFISDQIKYETLRTNFVSTRTPDVSVSEFNTENKVNKFLMVMLKELGDVKVYLHARDYEFKNSSIGKHYKAVFEKYLSYVSPTTLNTREEILMSFIRNQMYT